MTQLIRTFVLSSALGGLAFLATGCAAHVGATKLAPDSGAECTTQCEELGMELSAVAIMANNVGCVCKASSASSAPDVDDHASSTAGGMTAILIQREAARQQQQNSTTN